METLLTNVALIIMLFFLITATKQKAVAFSLSSSFNTRQRMVISWNGNPSIGLPLLQQLTRTEIIKSSVFCGITSRCTRCFGSNSNAEDLNIAYEASRDRVSNLDRGERDATIPTIRTTTQYTITEDICSRIDEAELRRMIEKHCEYFGKYLERKPIAVHTQTAFDQVYSYILKDPLLKEKNIILDSGCGTGRSSLLLGEKYPNHIIIGIDRSFVRLTRNRISRSTINTSTTTNTMDSNDSDENNDSNNLSAFSLRPVFETYSSNVILVRAELVDFWRCCINVEWNKNNKISSNYILYPNPYPKKNRIKKRFYAHPSFPLILGLNSNTIILRSNWLQYLEEFVDCIKYANDYYNDTNSHPNLAAPYIKDARIGPKERIDKQIAWTNFEKKYDDIGESTYEVILRRDINSN